MKTMKCRQVENNLTGYIENMLTPSLMLDIKEHIEACEACKYIYLQVKDTLNTLDICENTPTPDLYSGISRKLNHHQATIVEFVPRHKILYRVAASIIVIIGMSFGIFVGSKYYATKNITTQTNNQTEVSEFYLSETNSMDGESGLAMLYTNE
jgi:hypothetical protein